MAKRKAPNRANHVRSRRRRADLTQAELASRVDVSRQTIASIEAGGYAPSVYLALRLAAVFDVTVETLFGAETGGTNDD